MNALNYVCNVIVILDICHSVCSIVRRRYITDMSTVQRHNEYCEYGEHVERGEHGVCNEHGATRVTCMP